MTRPHFSCYNMLFLLRCYVLLCGRNSGNRCESRVIDDVTFLRKFYPSRGYIYYIIILHLYYTILLYYIFFITKVTIYI